MLHSVRRLKIVLLLPLLTSPSPISKISLSTFEYRNLFPQPSLSKTVVRSITRSFRRFPDLWSSQAGIKYELVGRVCIQGKSYVSPSMVIICL
jgi:hypothetical protein